jgi:hypothetical protein
MPIATWLANTTGKTEADTSAVAVARVAQGSASRKLTIPARTVTALQGGLWRPLAWSGVAVTAPEDTAENILATATIPAGALGPNGVLRISGVLCTNANSGSNKIWTIRLGGIGGTVVHQTTNTTNTTLIPPQILIFNQNAANSQVTRPSNNTIGPTTGAIVTASIDTASATTLVLTCTKATGSDAAAFRSWMVEALYGA